MIDEKNEEYETIMFSMTPFYIRKGNFGDMYTLRENITGKQYRNLMLNPTDVILDIGGHIGTFAVPVSRKVQQVISVEMDSDNYNILEANTRFYKNITPLNLAVVSNDNADESVKYFRASKNSGAHSIYVTKKRGYPFYSATIRIGELLLKYKPTIIKCDAEGSEFDIFDGLILPPTVKQMIIEFHFGHKKWRELANQLIAQFASQGFRTSDSTDMTANKNWTRVIYFERS